MKASTILTLVGFFGIAFGTTLDWHGRCLYFGIWALFMSLVLDLNEKEDK